MMDYKEHLKKIWSVLYEPNADVPAVIERFFHPDYEQSINGVILRRGEYTEHVIAQKNNIVLESIDYKHMLESGDELFALYFPKGKDAAGKLVVVEVIAYFKFKGDQIINIHGQVRMIEGKPSDVDM